MATTEAPTETGQATADTRQQRHESRTGTTFRAFIEDLSTSAGLSEEMAARSTGAVLLLLEQRLQPGAARNLEAQLPDKIRELLSDCDRPLTGAPLQKFDRDEFLDRVCRALSVNAEMAEGITRYVFSTVRSHISDGEAEKIAAQLPRDLASLWAAPA